MHSIIRSPVSVALSVRQANKRNDRNTANECSIQNPGQIAIIRDNDVASLLDLAVLATNLYRIYAMRTTELFCILCAGCIVLWAQQRITR